MENERCGLTFFALRYHRMKCIPQGAPRFIFIIKFSTEEQRKPIHVQRRWNTRKDSLSQRGWNTRKDSDIFHSPFSIMPASSLLPETMTNVILTNK